MNKLKKAKIKKFIKEKWVLLGGSALFLIVGLVVLLVGFQMTGWSIIDWIKSPYCATAIILFLIGGIFLLLLVNIIKRIHLGD